jgi:hypothetical protein
VSVTTLRPNGTLGNSAVLTGGATAHAVLSDDDDLSYASYPNFNYVTQLSLGTWSLPAGAVTLGARLRVRQRHTTSPLQWRVQLYDPTRLNADGTGYLVYLSAPLRSQGAVTTTPTATTARLFTQAEIDGLSVAIDRDAGPGAGNVYEVYVDLIYVEVPGVTVTAPTGTITDTNRPTVIWSTAMDSAGGAQTHYEVKVFSAAQYTAGGFDPDTSPATDASGIVASTAAMRQAAAILADGAYRAYVRVAQTVNGALHWSDWDYEAFTVDVLLPASPTMALFAQSASGRIQIDLSDNAGDASTTALELQRATPDFASNLVPDPATKNDGAQWYKDNIVFIQPTGTTITVETDGLAPRGFEAVQVTGTGAADQGAAIFLGSLQAGQTYAVRISLRRMSGTDTIKVAIGRDTFPHEEVVVVAAAAPGSSDYTEYTALVTPAFTDLHYLYVRKNGSDPIAFRFNKVLVAPSSVMIDYFDGDTAGYEWVGTPHASASQRGSWVPVRNDAGDDGVYVASDAMIWDYEASNGIPTRYRARALHDYSGQYAASEWVMGAATWESSQWWLKHPSRPAFNVPVELFSYANVERAARRGILHPLGARLPVVISDTRGGAGGSIVIQARTVAAQDALDALLDTTAVVLLQGPAAHGEPDRYVSLGDASAVRLVDNGRFHVRRTTIPWSEVARPLGALAGEYSGPVEDDGEELILI